jgi:hypothetical protein
MRKIGTLRWLGQLFSVQELDPCRKLIVHKPEGTRRAGRPKLKWNVSVEEDGREELDVLVTGPRTLEDNFGRGRSTKGCSARRKRKRLLEILIQ